MSELTLLLLRLTFLGVMWAFVFAVVYALRTDLFGQKVRKQSDTQAPAFAGSSPTPPVASAAAAPRESSSGQSNGASVSATRLVITGGAKEGLELSLPPEQLTIGRASESGLVIRDDYTSTHHARLLLWNDGWVIQDLDSTNGTFLDGVRVVVPTQVPLNTPVKIGTTSFELRR
ncbi:MAG: FHA domain-containing protein FhaB/FipA [Microbacteriaceae bacterium]